MTRAELYELVWKEPMIHAAKRFGISDVAEESDSKQSRPRSNY
jgi:hypothetical protein